MNTSPTPSTTSVHAEPSTSQARFTAQIAASSAPQIAPNLSKLDAAIAKTSQLPKRPDGRKPHILFITGGVGGGHKSPADAVVSHLVNDSRVDVTYYRETEVGQFIYPNRGRRDDILYRASNNKWVSRIANAWRSVAKQAPTYRTMETLLKDSSEFDLVVVNHRILGQAVAKHLSISTPMHLETTDPGNMHVGWYPRDRFYDSQSRDKIIVPNQTGYRHAQKHLEASKIEEIPYGVRQAFEDISNRQREEVREELNWPRDKRVVVHSCGGGGQASAYSLSVVKNLLMDLRAPSLHMVVIAGNNPALEQSFRELKEGLGRQGDNLEIHGLCSQEKMAQLQYAADCPVIDGDASTIPPGFPEIQAGGGSIGENAAMGNVPIVYQKKSGIEDANVKFVENHGVGFVALTQKAVIETVFTATRADIETKREKVVALGVKGGAASRARFHADRALESFQRSQDSAPR